MSDLQAAGVRVDGRQNVDEECDEQQQRIEHGHRLQQEDGRRLSLVLTQHEERRDVAGQAEDADKTDDDCTDDELKKLTAGFVRVRVLLGERRQSHIVSAFHRHLVNAALATDAESEARNEDNFQPAATQQ